jgi:hypothetical protein
MVSVAPVNHRPAGLSLLKLCFQPNRYAWELGLPRRQLNRPPVLSTCWLIKRDFLLDAGGFKAVASSASPESYFARRALKQEDGYSFLRSADLIGLTSNKPYPDQVQTAIRTRYPQTHRRPELVCLLSLIEIVVFIGPLVLLVVSLWAGHLGLAFAGLVDLFVVGTFYSIIASLTYGQTMLLCSLLLPLAAVVDVVILNYSMWLYEFREVIWKGRNICLPIMKTY